MMCYVRPRTSTILWDDVAAKNGYGIWNLECEGSGSLKPVGKSRMYVTYIESTVGQKGQRWLESAEDYTFFYRNGDENY